MTLKSQQPNNANVLETIRYAKKCILAIMLGIPKTPKLNMMSQ
jgi:hypothetical protein